MNSATKAFKHDLLGMKSRTVILQTPRVNHHRIPSVREGRNLFLGSPVVPLSFFFWGGV